MQPLTEHPLVDIVIPVHSLSRPLARAVESAVTSVRSLEADEWVITVVAHHLTADQVREVLPESLTGVVRFIEAAGEGRTAAAPRTAGVEHTDATYICFLDSDDTLEPDAVTRWVKLAQDHHSDMVIPWLKHSNGRVDITPVVRPGRSSRLDPVADRLVYRASVFGLQRVATVRRLGASFDFGTSTGEDQSFVLRMYTGSERIDYAPGSPTYVMHADATDRVSQSPSPVRSQMEPAVRIMDMPWFREASSSFRRSFVVKAVRINAFEAVGAHLGAGTWSLEEARGAQKSISSLLRAVPDARGDFSRADHRLIDMLLTGTAEEGPLHTALAQRRRFASPAALLTRVPRTVLRRDAPVRFMAAAAAQTVRDRWGKRR